MFGNEQAEDPALSEALGRGVFSSRHADRAKRSGVPKRVFLERKGMTEISVDRLDLMSGEKAHEMARAAADKRSANFYGWAVLITEIACRSNRRVTASPKPSGQAMHRLRGPTRWSKDAGSTEAARARQRTVPKRAWRTRRVD